MSRFKGPRLKIVRRLGQLPALTSKESIRRFPPGDHGEELAKRKKNKKLSAYSFRLQEKQRLRYFYGLTERQLLNYVRKARKIEGSAGEILLQLLELRLDAVVFRLGFAPTIIAARQIVNHGHITINGKVVDIPSYGCNLNDKIQVKQSKNSETLIQSNLSKFTEKSYFEKFKKIPHIQLENYSSLDCKSFQATVRSFVDPKSIDLDIEERLVIEYYSRLA